jgi:hypothetical protein
MNPEDLQQLYRYYQLAGVRTAFATAMSGPWAAQSRGMANTVTFTASPPMEPDGVPGSHPLERILDGLEKSGPERIEKFL